MNYGLKMINHNLPKKENLLEKVETLMSLKNLEKKNEKENEKGREKGKEKEKRKKKKKKKEKGKEKKI